MNSEFIKSTDEPADNIIQNNSPELNAKVSISLSMQRNLGQYENCHFSIRYEQNCRPEERAAMTEILEREATAWIMRRSAGVDDYLRKRQYEAQSQGQAF